MKIETPIKAQKTVELVGCGVDGVREAKVLELNTSSIEFVQILKLLLQVMLISILGLRGLFCFILIKNVD